MKCRKGGGEEEERRNLVLSESAIGNSYHIQPCPIQCSEAWLKLKCMCECSHSSVAILKPAHLLANLATLLQLAQADLLTLKRHDQML